MAALVQAVKAMIMRPSQPIRITCTCRGSFRALSSSPPLLKAGEKWKDSPRAVRRALARGEPGIQARPALRRPPFKKTPVFDRPLQSTSRGSGPLLSSSSPRKSSARRKSHMLQDNTEPKLAPRASTKDKTQVLLSSTKKRPKWKEPRPSLPLPPSSSSRGNRMVASSRTSFSTKGDRTTLAQPINPTPKPPPAWLTQKVTLRQNFPEGWKPPRRLSREATSLLRALHKSAPQQITTPILADRFKISPEAVRRILKAKFELPTQEAERRERKRKEENQKSGTWAGDLAAQQAEMRQLREKEQMRKMQASRD